MAHVRSTPYPHLAERVHVHSTAVVLGLEEPAPEYDRFARHLRALQRTIETIQRLAVTGRTLFEFDERP